VVVSNPLGWVRTDAVSVDLGFAEREVRSVRLIGPDGEDVPVQATATERFADGSLRRARVTFVARDVPALGHATYRVVTTADAPAVLSAPEPDPAGDALENEFVRVRVDRRTGAIVSLFDKIAGAETLSGPANIIARQDDRGDLWEPYHPLNGAMSVVASEVHPVPSAANALLSAAYADRPGAIRRGPVFDEFEVSHPFASGSFATRVRVYRGVRRVDIETTLVNNDKQVRYQALFPTIIQGGRNVQEIPFGAVERPIGVEYPAQRWVDYGDGKRGVALLNEGLPGNLVNEDTLILSLLRSQTLGDYNEGRPSESGYELGAPRTFRYALVPHSGDWREAGVHRMGAEFCSPLDARKSASHAGVLPARWSLAQVSDPNVLLSCVKPGPGRSTILRLYEATGRPATGVKVRLAAGVMAAWEADLLERAGKRLAVQGDTLTLDFGAFEIKTVKLKVRKR
jgi:alpha-mannosidase